MLQDHESGNSSTGVDVGSNPALTTKEYAKNDLMWVRYLTKGNVRRNKLR
jgi:hypothetical protein